MRSVLLLGAVVLPAVVLAGCGNGVEHVGGPAAPVTASPSPVVTSAPGSSSAPATSSSPSETATATATSTKPATPVLGAKGFGALKIGMTKSQATDTGLIRPWGPSFEGAPTNAEGCAAKTTLKKGNDDQGFVYYSTKNGVQIIDAYPGVNTPEGIHIGSSAAAVKKAYPNYSSIEEGTLEGRGYTGALPGNSNTQYRVDILNGKVRSLTLQHVHQDCYE